MAARECSLCREAEKQPAEPGVFFLKDVNPRKPNRWLALLRQHVDGDNPLAAMTPWHSTAMPCARSATLTCTSGG